ncbi:MAG: STN domain-containing protein [Thermogutta sp.]|nr:STN domain-containing protein [Thermogutta sp.]HOP78875.1 STN domain-containing protein [Thermogutta sp.]HPU08047.1 STN domain-containing protein [Thermogutta sp.]HQF15087.1 STN domain-containing protein [Thermogutta sp.]
MRRPVIRSQALLIGPVLALVCVGISPAWCQEGPSFVIGNEFLRRLDTPTGIFWTDVPLREGLLRLGRTHQVAIVLDRRCDPDQELTLTVRDRPLREVIAAIAEACGVQSVVVSPIVYVGPPEAVQRLESLMVARRQEALKLGKVGLAGLRPLAVSWPRLTTPRQLVTLWLQEANWRLTNPDEILHDLWPEGSLPPLTLVDRLTLVLAQFDRTFELNESGEIRIVPITNTMAVARQFSVGPQARILAQQWQKMFPDCKVTTFGQDVVVEGPRETLDKLADLLRTQKGPTAPRGSDGPPPTTPEARDPFEQRRFTVREGRGTLEGVIRQLAQQLEMQVDFNRQSAIEAGIRLDQPIRFQVQNGTIDELWRAVLDPHGLTFRRVGRSITIYPKR